LRQKIKRKKTKSACYKCSNDHRKTGIKVYGLDKNIHVYGSKKQTKKNHLKGTGA